MTDLTVPILGLWGFLGFIGDSDMLQLGQSSSNEQQHACEELQTIGEPGKGQGPAKRGANAGQALWSFQFLGLCEGPVRVADVEADPTQA